MMICDKEPEISRQVVFSGDNWHWSVTVDGEPIAGGELPDFTAANSAAWQAYQFASEQYFC